MEAPGADHRTAFETPKFTHAHPQEIDHNHNHQEVAFSVIRFSWDERSKQEDEFWITKIRFDHLEAFHRKPRVAPPWGRDSG